VKQTEGFRSISSFVRHEIGALQISIDSLRFYQSMMASIVQTLDISLLRLALIGIVGTVLISIRRSVLKGRGGVPEGVKPLPGPKGEESIPCAPIIFSEEEDSDFFVLHSHFTYTYLCP
jgi:hypothetical protein